MDGAESAAYRNIKWCEDTLSKSKAFRWPSRKSVVRAYGCLKSNFLGTLREGAIVGESHLVRGGRTTQVWDATVTREDNSKMLALFRCTQIILYRNVPGTVSTRP